MMSHATSPVVSGPPLEGMEEFASVNEVFVHTCGRFADKPAFTCMGQTLSYAELERLSRDFAAWLSEETDLVQGDRIAIQLPNVLQFPVAIFGAIRAGLVVVNTNPLYTEREMAHQFQDADVKAILILANMADKLERILPRTAIRHVLVTELGDMHDFPKRTLINAVVKHVKKMVPRYTLPEATRFRDALTRGRGQSSDAAICQTDDVAVLQYTGGTTGVAKGTMLTHRNLIANMLQTRQMIAGLIEEGRETIIAPLPVYHIYTFTVNCLFTMITGNHTVLIPNPRDIDGFIKTLRKTDYTGFVGLNTLFNALCQREDFRALDFSRLKLTISGGMALTKAAAKRWEEVTGCAILEGYGMTETSPIVCVNPPDGIQLGTIGKPVPGTSIKVIGPEGEEVARGDPGELCVQGPQVMKGYWNRPEDTARTLDAESWIRTGDIAVIQEDDYVRIVDRKKDMIIVSGFNVYPNEIEDVVATHEDVIEVAAIGVPDDASGEAIKLFVVSRDEALDAETLRAWCKQELSAYKVPKLIEFRDELPKTNVGKVLRRELRDSQDSKESAPGDGAT
ncbi:AMP-binding protein [Chromohalobacter sp. 296-RDG]|uniref:AMP-binding protein n=1 Tax=Chromohalobacter sp. 296-RDG TaxID=2994062 RepID=UPI0024687FB8|nr:AMP-binding protein [Chromohalobacter sp. 296-RDG]